MNDATNVKNITVCGLCRPAFVLMLASVLTKLGHRVLILDYTASKNFRYVIEPVAGLMPETDIITTNDIGYSLNADESMCGPYDVRIRVYDYTLPFREDEDALVIMADEHRDTFTKLSAACGVPESLAVKADGDEGSLMFGDSSEVEVQGASCYLIIYGYSFLLPEQYREVIRAAAVTKTIGIPHSEEDHAAELNIEYLHTLSEARFSKPYMEAIMSVIEGLGYEVKESVIKKMFAKIRAIKHLCAIKHLFGRR